MDFDEALAVLNIADYKEQIVDSNSHGELFHLLDYIKLAEILKDNASQFREWFEYAVSYTKENWQRPQSVFQHIQRLFFEHIKEGQ